jgi:hypothetical protein
MTTLPRQDHAAEVDSLDDLLAAVDAMSPPVDLRRQTQTNTTPGNCWQTAMACLLGLPAAALPDQVAIEERKDSYHNALMAYLDKHHGLTFFTLYDWQIPAVRLPDPGLHIVIGPTVRTPDNGVKHAVVGQHGRVLWDPHPSRAGLTGTSSWEVLVPVSGAAKDVRDRAKATERGWLPCPCPACAVTP